MLVYLLLGFRIEKDFDEERKKWEIINQKLKEQIEKKEEKIINEQKEFRQKIIEQKREVDEEKEKMIRDFQAKVQEIRRQHLVWKFFFLSGKPPQFLN